MKTLFLKEELFMRKNDFVSIGNTEMYYVSFGSGTRKLVALPGLSDGLATVKDKAWILSAPYKKFLGDYTIYMFSRNNAMPDGYSIMDMADDQILAMTKLGIDRACLLGVSQGGMIAQCIAAKHPEMVEKLILAVTSPYANEVVKETVTTWIEMAEHGDHTVLMTDTAERMYSETFLRKNRKFIPVLARLTRPENYDRFLKNAHAILGFDARAELSKITCPTLILAGSDDHVVGNDAPYELRDGIPGSELYIWEGLGHGAFEEAKDFYDKVLEFCGNEPRGQVR